MNATLPAIKTPLVVDNDPNRVLNVLILDDQETDRMRLRRMCRKAGLEFTVFEAEDLEQFRAILDKAVIDLAFLDHHLANATGHDALKILIAHEDQVDAVPIMVTGVERHDIAVAAMRDGCADYITKEELSVDMLRKSITSAFERRVLLAALGEAHSSRNRMRLSISRIAHTCGPEIRTSLAATLRHVRALRNSKTLDEHGTRNLAVLENSCTEIFGFLEEIKNLLEGGPDKSDQTVKLLSRSG